MVTAANVKDRGNTPVLLSREDLIAAWISAHGNAPPKRTSNRLLILSEAYHRQAKASPLSKRAERALLKWAAKAPPPPPSSVLKPKLPTGTRLVREWNGRDHIVDIVDGAVIYDGQTYRSLSQVARTITGAHWSGPRFFGVAGK